MGVVPGPSLGTAIGRYVGRQLEESLSPVYPSLPFDCPLLPLILCYQNHYGAMHNEIGRME